MISGLPFVLDANADIGLSVRVDLHQPAVEWPKQRTPCVP